MIKIGDFARLSQISVVTLRHYDEMGLLEPIQVDQMTGYRYYSVSQLPRLNRILALKDLGFSLEQIRLILNGGVSLERLRGMLMLRHSEVEQQLAEEKARLKRIEARLRQIELEDQMSDYEVVLKAVPPMLIASQRVRIPLNEQVPSYLDAAYCNVYNFLGEKNVKPRGANITIWHQPADVYVDEEAEAAVPISQAIPSQDEVLVYELPAAQVISAVHHGNFEDFTHLHTVLLKWAEEHDYRIAGPYREIYIQHDTGNLKESTTEVQYPVEKIS